MISICMPYWDRQTQLDSSLDLYRALYPDVDLEVSIADDGSQTPVYATGCLITFLPKKAAALNPCVPINVAVKASHGDVIVLTNPEVHHRDQILQEMHAELRRAGTRGYVTASCRNDSGEWLAHSRPGPTIFMADINPGNGGWLLIGSLVKRICLKF